MPHPVPPPDLPPMERLRRIMHLLRAPGGCPWDAEQTHESLVKHLIEEAYEVADAVASGETAAIVDELGDLLLQPVFHAEIASERGDFNFDDIASAICEKLIRRHPHVFGDAVAGDAGAVLAQWEQIKASEKTGDAENSESREPAPAPGYLGKANPGLPALLASQKLQKRAAKAGFDWPTIDGVLDKVREETEEAAEALRSGDEAAVAEEIGDLLFAAVNLARKAGFEAELLLHAANRKFVDRFQQVEAGLRDSGIELEAASLEEMEAHWQAAKKRL